jgi:hypothetical protein
MNTSLVKSNTLDNILKESRQNIEVLKKQMEDYFYSLNPEENTYYSYKGLFLKYKTAVTYINKELILPKENSDKLNYYIDIYMEEKSNLEELIWYVKTVLNTSKNLDIAKEAIPEYLHKYLESVNFLGTEECTKIEKYYNMLLEAPIKATLLGN